MTPDQFVTFVAEKLDSVRMLLSRAEKEFHEQREESDPVAIYTNVNGAIAHLQTLADGLEKHAKSI
jgi:hypothetical protein